MHDPMVMVFDVHLPVPERQRWREHAAAKRWSISRTRRTNKENLGEPVYPWFRAKGYATIIAGRVYGWSNVMDVWHVEPDDRDSGTVCKGLRGSDLTAHNVAWAWKHRSHLKITVILYRDVKRWLYDRCAECGYRFLWKQSRFGYQGSDKVWHDKCMSLGHTRGQLEDAAKALTFTANDTERFRVERWLSWREEQAEKALLSDAQVDGP